MSCDISAFGVPLTSSGSKIGLDKYWKGHQPRLIFPDQLLQRISYEIIKENLKGILKGHPAIPPWIGKRESAWFPSWLQTLVVKTQQYTQHASLLLSFHFWSTKWMSSSEVGKIRYDSGKIQDEWKWHSKYWISWKLIFFEESTHLLPWENSNSEKCRSNLKWSEERLIPAYLATFCKLNTLSMQNAKVWKFFLFCLILEKKCVIIEQLAVKNNKLLKFDGNIDGSNNT